MANYDVESRAHTYRIQVMFCFLLFLAPYARTTRYEEAFFSLEKQGKEKKSFVRLMTIFIQIISEHNLKKKMATKAVLIEGLFV